MVRKLATLQKKLLKLELVSCLFGQSYSVWVSIKTCSKSIPKVFVLRYLNIKVLQVQEKLECTGRKLFTERYEQN